MKVSTTIYIERGDAEIAAQVTGNYRPGQRGVKAHMMDRFTPHDDQPEIEDIEATGPDGLIDLTEEEVDSAHEKLMEVAAGELDYQWERRINPDDQ